ncbi:MAG TPA: SRPBCC family protein [Actinophytocola sp.]|uniref:SRPBCC family protein n=1 Tax=Actinophytocola sp. TaxID=1872138 RepID=UPI002F91CC62
MISVSAVLPAPPAAVFDVLADGWSYAGWVVGATHVRKVDEGWPAVGTRIHHSVGVWPFVLDDVTEVTAVEGPLLLELDARLSPIGSARVRFELAPSGPHHTTVRMAELVETGPARLLPRAAQALLLIPRNLESLARLGHLAGGRTR